MKIIWDLTMILRYQHNKVLKAYVDSAVVGLLDYKGAYNASTNSPDLDTTPSGILKGDTYTVTVAGTFYGTAFLRLEMFLLQRLMMQELVLLRRVIGQLFNAMKMV